MVILPRPRRARRVAHRPATPGFHYRAAVPFERPEPACRRALLALAAQSVERFAATNGLPPRRLNALTWLVPAGAHAAAARAALRAQLGGAAFMPPRVVPLGAWLGRPLRGGMGTRAELFAALRDNDWVRDAFGAQPAALWALAAGVARFPTN